MNHFRPLAIVGLALLAGCSMKPAQGPTKSSEKAAKADPWPAAASILRRQPDLGGARQAISLLTAELADNPEFESPAALPADVAARYVERLRLAPEELRDVAGTTLTNLDAAYVVECLILRDAMRSLDLGALSPERKAQVAFDWVCRQIYRKQGTVLSPRGPTYCPPIPPQFALNRGYGSGLDRAYVFLAALQQLGLDGCFVGPPNREESPSFEIEDGKVGKGPFWAVGARLADGAVLLFEPWRGEAWPGPNGTVATLAQIQSNPDSLKPWFDDKANPWDVSPADIKSATVYVAAPNVALSPRLKLLEKKIATEVGVKLVRDPMEIATRFGPQAKVWAPPAARDKFCLTRVLSSFLPVEEGGAEHPALRELRLYEQTTKLSPIPLDLFTAPPEIVHDEVRNALKGYFARRFSELIVDSNPRERICRGQYNDVIRTMVERERQFGTARERSRLTDQPDDAVAKWSEQANELYQKLSLARLPQNQAGLPDAQAAVDLFWQKGGPVIQLIDDRRIIPICAAEAGYILAVCKHEQAERATIRLGTTPAKDAKRDETAAAKDAWLVAKDAWDRYFTVAEAYLKANPERASHSRKLAERATRLAKE